MTASFMQSRKDKPIPLRLPHPLHVAGEGAEVCLFVKDHKGEGHKEAKEKLGAFEKSGGVHKIIGLSKLKTKYESHESKRELCKLYDIFLADERILPSLPKLIGKSFFKKKKQPIPIKITGKNFPNQVKKALSCTYLYKNSGTCLNIKVGLSSFSEAQLAENVHSVLVQMVEHVPKKWGNIRSIFLKTPESVALPVWQTVPEGLKKIDSSAPVSASKAVKGKEANAKTEPVAKASVGSKAKGTKVVKGVSKPAAKSGLVKGKGKK